MKMFHIGDILTCTTGRLVSSRRMDAVYDLLGFLTGESGLYTHQLPRVMDECKPWIAAQYPQLMEDSPIIVGFISGLDSNLKLLQRHERDAACARWVEAIRDYHKLPEVLPLYAMGEGMHTSIDPIEELDAMVGKDKILTVEIT